jgi:outer membrane protein assembly factor BamB
MHMREYAPGWIALAVVLGLGTTGRGEDWPGWRGPTGMGVSAEKKLPRRWGGKGDENVRWKVALPGVEEKARQDQNQSSPVVAGGRVFVTASYWPAGKSEKDYPEHHVVCYAAADGKVRWDVKVEPGPWKLTDLRGGYTAPTPAADGERVYVTFGSSVLAALDVRDGKQVWRQEITPYNFDVACGGSPVLFEDTVLLQCDQIKNTSMLLAFDRKTGAKKWEAKRPGVSFSHSTPTLVTVGKKPQLLVAASNALQGVDPANGKVLWWCEAAGDTVSPVYGEGLVYLDSGRGSVGVCVDPTGTGNVTKSHLKWKLNRVPEGFSSPVVVGAYLYRLQNPGVLRCTKMATGEEVYTERLEGVATRCSPFVTADGLIYLASAGKTFVVKPGPKLAVVAVSDLGDASDASAAVADGRIYLKGRKYLYCIGSKR